MATAAKVTVDVVERPFAGRTADLSRSNIQLSILAERITSATQQAGELIARRSAVDLMWHPEAESWSVAECLDHVAQTTLAFLPAIREAVASAPALSTDRALRTGMLARLFVRNLEPPYRIHLKVLPQLEPQCKDFDSAWRNFVDAQSQLKEAVRSAADLAIDRVKVKSPIYARLSYNIYGALCILVAHQRRHLWQINRILQALDAQRAGNSSGSSN